MPRVLYIEDDPANRLLVRKLLVAAGFEVLEAVDGLEGVREARERRPDLVLVDIAIPGLDGYEVTLRLRAEPGLERVPIVAITAEGNRETSLAVGCDGFLQKPIDARTFAKTVGGYLAGYREASPVALGEPALRRQSQRIVGRLEEKVAELSAVNQRLVEANEARKAFYRNVSHELATPMTPIVGYLKLLVDQELGALAPPQMKALGAMQGCVQRLQGLIDDLLDVTGLETGRLRFARREYDLRDVVKRALERMRDRLQHHRILIDLPDPMPAIGDPERLRRAVEHLVDNAVKFTPRGGLVGLRGQIVAPDHLELVVADSGPGVVQGLDDRLFDPFCQGDGSPTRQFGGTGAGLAIVRGIARGHGGEIELRRGAPEHFGGEECHGAVFVLTLAMEPEDPTA